MCKVIKKDDLGNRVCYDTKDIKGVTLSPPNSKNIATVTLRTPLDLYELYYTDITRANKCFEDICSSFRTL